MNVRIEDSLWTIFQDGEMLVRLHADKTMEFGPNYKPEAAAKIFWDAVLEEMNRRPWNKEL